MPPFKFETKKWRDHWGCSYDLGDGSLLDFLHYVLCAETVRNVKEKGTGFYYIIIMLPFNFKDQLASK